MSSFLGGRNSAAMFNMTKRRAVKVSKTPGGDRVVASQPVGATTKLEIQGQADSSLPVRLTRRQRLARLDAHSTLSRLLSTGKAPRVFKSNSHRGERESARKTNRTHARALSSFFPPAMQAACADKLRRFITTSALALGSSLLRADIEGQRLDFFISDARSGSDTERDGAA